jgi:formylglycine-generating enzyme required for sulfatase activity
MKKIYCHIIALLFALPVFSQANTDANVTHGKAAKHTEQDKAPLDPKLAEVVKSIEAKMIAVDGGNFTMGCNNPLDTECVGWEKPRHTVTIKSFKMSKFDVTQKEWKAIMGTTPSGKYCADCPVVNVTWFDVQMFINKLNQLSDKNYRLPNEAEWEYAAKGGNKGHGYIYSGANEANEVAWYDSVRTKEIRPVGGKKANELGIFDLSGDVWQWCTDWFDEKYYANSPSNGPTGPSVATKEKVVRGGSWWGPRRDCRAANRDKFPPESKDDDVGFRIVRY